MAYLERFTDTDILYQIVSKLLGYYGYLTPAKNFRRAIEEGMAILEKNPVGREALLYLIRLTEKTKDPSLLVAWVEDWRRLQKLLKDLAEWQSQLQKLPDQLREAEPRISELSARLKHR